MISSLLGCYLCYLSKVSERACPLRQRLGVLIADVAHVAVCKVDKWFVTVIRSIFHPFLHNEFAGQNAINGTTVKNVHHEKGL